MEYSLPFICLCLAMWLCLKMCYEKIVPVRLLKIGATDITVSPDEDGWNGFWEGLNTLKS